MYSIALQFCKAMELPSVRLHLRNSLPKKDTFLLYWTDEFPEEKDVENFEKKREVFNRPIVWVCDRVEAGRHWRSRLAWWCRCTDCCHRESTQIRPDSRNQRYTSKGLWKIRMIIHKGLKMRPNFYYNSKRKKNKNKDLNFHLPMAIGCFDFIENLIFDIEFVLVCIRVQTVSFQLNIAKMDC